MCWPHWLSELIANYIQPDALLPNFTPSTHNKKTFIQNYFKAISVNGKLSYAISEFIFSPVWWCFTVLTSNLFLKKGEKLSLLKHLIFQVQLWIDAFSPKAAATKVLTKNRKHPSNVDFNHVDNTIINLLLFLFLFGFKWAWFE